MHKVNLPNTTEEAEEQPLLAQGEVAKAEETQPLMNEVGKCPSFL